MEYFRDELFPNVYLTVLHTDKFKTGCLSMTLLTQLSREKAAENAVIPYVLRRGTTSLPDMSVLSARLDELYGASIEPIVRKRGEIHCIGFRADFCDDAFLPEGAEVLENVIRLMGELWLSPRTKGGLLQSGYVESERDKLIERMDAAKNDKRSYAVRRMLENMCAFEDYAVDRLGSRDEADNIHYVKLSKDYKTLLASAPIEIFYCGSRKTAEVRALLEEALFLLPRGEAELDLGTDIRMNAVEENPRYFTEEMDVTQGNLAVGFRLGECMEDPDPAAIRVFNAVYGGCSTSKLFVNVRERLSLCYYASSIVDLDKGILTVTSGIEFDKYQAALDEILAQLEAVARGEITDDELQGAKNAVANGLRSITDDPDALESFYLSQTLLGLEYGPMEMAELVDEVTAEEVAEIARGVELDAVYFLKGEDAE